MSNARDPSRPRRNSPRPPTRRDLLALGVGAFVVAASPLALGRRRRLLRRKVPVMGTLADLAVVTDDPRRARAGLDEAVAALREVDRTMSRFRRDSDVGRVNAAAGRGAVEVGEETAFVLEKALAFAGATGGVFDPCLGRAVALWDVGHRTTPPDAARAARLAGGQPWLALDLDRGASAARRVRLGRSDAALDLGGIAKGHGVDRAAAALRRHGFRDALVNVGGDLVALGESPDGDPWRVGVRDPRDPDGVVGTLEVRDEAVATSGDYEHFFRHGGRRYHHLLDPRTGAPGTSGAHGVTVRAPTCLEADAAATTAFLLGPGEAETVLAKAAPGAVLVARS